MKPPCMIIVKMVLPSLRVEIARSLVEERGMKPISAAKAMDVTPAAVTQYLKGVRGMGPVEGRFREGWLKSDVEELIEAMVKDPPDYAEVLGKLCSLCKALRRSGLVCDECKRASPALSSLDCSFCRV
ncbi:MAG: hypothetical protein QW390_01380 [Candidatus Bathyarchaeia archaeon]